MNLDTVSSPTKADEACSLRSLLTLGCRSRAEAFAKKLQTKLWSLGPMESNGQSDSGFHNHDVHTWVTVEARLDATSSVVTSVPIVSKVHREELVLSREDMVLRNKTAPSSDEDPRSHDGQVWDVLAPRNVGRESIDRESDASSTNKHSDSDQYFDFGIDSPLDPELESELPHEEEALVVNADDGLPSQPESGCVFTSPVHSGSDSSSDDSEEDTSFYDVESLSQSPAAVAGKTFETLSGPAATGRNYKDPGDKKTTFVDLNLLANDIAKVIPDKLSSSAGEYCLRVSKAEQRAAACPQISFCTEQDAVSVTVEQEEQPASMLSHWQEPKSPALLSDAIPDINADVPAAATREGSSRGRAQGELEDISFEPGTSIDSIRQSDCNRRYEQPQVPDERNVSGQLKTSQLEILCSDFVLEESELHEDNAICHEMVEPLSEETVTCIMYPNESLTANVNGVTEISCELSSFQPSPDKYQRVSESSSGYAESIASCDNELESHTPAGCLSENDSDSSHSDTECGTNKSAPECGIVDPEDESTSCDVKQSDSDRSECRTDESAAECGTLKPEDASASCDVKQNDSDQSDGCPDPSRVDLSGEQSKVIDNEEDDDGDFISRRHRVQRSTSLKTGKTPPGTPGRKKIVRFADALGLDLAAVRTFMDEIPNVPQSAFQDLSDAEHINDSPDSQSNLLVGFSGPYPRRQDLPLPAAPTTGFRTLIACFTSPGNLSDFLDRLKNQKVCLETAAMAEDMTVRGIIRCLNIDFHKSVILRVTTDEWLTFNDINAEYVVNSCDGLSDRFSFTLFSYSLQPGQRVIFAISYRVAGQEFWDNNFGLNYVFQCVAERATNSSSSALLSSPSADWLPYM